MTCCGRVEAGFVEKEIELSKEESIVIDRLLIVV